MLKKKNNYSYLILGFLLVILSYSPFLYFDFLYLDDYLYLFPKVGDSKNYTPLSDIELFYKEFHEMGRPLAGHLALLQQILIENIQAAKLFRFFSLILITIIFYLFFRYFVEKEFSKKESFIISFSIISLPTFNLTIAWLTLQQSLLSAIFSILSFLIIRNISKINSYKNLIKICFSIILLIVAIMIYPVPIMFFFIFYLMEIFFIYKKNNFKLNFNGTIIVIPLIIFFITLFITFILQKIYYQSGGSIEFNQLYKFLWFLKDIIPLSINFFYPSKSLILGIFFLIFLYGLINYIIYQKYEKNMSFYSLLMFSFIIFYSYFLLMPIVITSYHTPSFRIIPVVSSFYLIVFIFSLKLLFKNKIYNFIISIIFLLSFFTNYYQSHNYLGKPQSREFLNMKNVLKDNLNSNIKYIHILKPNWWSGVVPLQIFQGSDYGTYSTSVSPRLKNFVYLALKEINLDPDKFIVSSSELTPLTYRDRFSDPILKNNLVIIDFSDPMNYAVKIIND